MLKKSILALVFFIGAQFAFAQNKLSCQKPIMEKAMEPKSWETHCVFNGTSLNEAYQAYKHIDEIAYQNFPYKLPTEDTHITISDPDLTTIVTVKWKNPQSVSVVESYTGLITGTKVTFNVVNNKIKIVELGSTE